MAGHLQLIHVDSVHSLRTSGAPRATAKPSKRRPPRRSPSLRSKLLRSHAPATSPTRPPARARNAPGSPGAPASVPATPSPSARLLAGLPAGPTFVPPRTDGRFASALHLRAGRRHATQVPAAPGPRLRAAPTTGKFPAVRQATPTTTSPRSQRADQSGWWAPGRLPDWLGRLPGGCVPILRCGASDVPRKGGSEVGTLCARSGCAVTRTPLVAFAPKAIRVTTPPFRGRTAVNPASWRNPRWRCGGWEWRKALVVTTADR